MRHVPVQYNTIQQHLHMSSGMAESYQFNNNYLLLLLFYCFRNFLHVSFSVSPNTLSLFVPKHILCPFYIRKIIAILYSFY